MKYVSLGYPTRLALVVAFVPSGTPISTLALDAPVRKLRGNKVEVGGSRIRSDRTHGHRYLVRDSDAWHAVRVEADLLARQHEHADHPSYLFPVGVEFVGPPHPRDADILGTRSYTVALIYADDCVAMTLHECCYDLWLLEGGAHLHGESWHRGWRLSALAREEIRARCQPISSCQGRRRAPSG